MMFIWYFLHSVKKLLGIAGIEKKMQQKNEADNKNISKAFQDLDRWIFWSVPYKYF